MVKADHAYDVEKTAKLLDGKYPKWDVCRRKASILGGKAMDAFASMRTLTPIRNVPFRRVDFHSELAPWLFAAFLAGVAAGVAGTLACQWIF